MKVKFIKIEFKNILSYGNEKVEFKFEKGLNAITGKNGDGKSSIADVLTFCLFGRPFRDIKINELINRTNQKGLYTAVELEIDSIHYRIERGLKPTLFNFYKDHQELDLLSSKNLVQEEINELLGVDLKLFKQIITLSVNASKPFLTLGAYEKRRIIETIFDVDIFGEMLKDVKNNLTELKVDQKIKSNELTSSKSLYQSLVSQVSEYERMKDNFDRNKKDRIDNYENQIKDIDEDLESFKQSISNYNRELKQIKLELSLNEITEESNKLTAEVLSLKNENKKLEKDNNFLLDNDNCIYCGNEITEEHRDEHLKENKKLIDSNNKKIKENKDRINGLKSMKDLHERSNKIQRDINIVENKISSLEVRRIDFEKHIKDILKEKIEIDSKSLYENLNKKEEVYKSIELYLNSINKDMDLNLKASDILSDTGVKTYFFRKLLPLLNSYINKYLERFEVPFVFEFDDTLTEKITTVIGRVQEVSYFSCSEGEKKRIDISIMLSFIDIIKTISNWNCNLLFIDELLDSAVDSNNLLLILDAIRGMANENKDLSIYIISHRADNRGWDKIYNIEKSGGFSKISCE